MGKLTNKNTDKMFETLKKAIDDKESVIVTTDNMQLVMGEPIGLCANLMGIIETIRKQDVVAKIAVKAMLKALEDDED